MADDRVPDENVLLAEDAHEFGSHLFLELLAALAVDELAGLVVRALHAGDREDLRHDDLRDDGGKIAVEHEYLRDLLGHQLELYRHVEHDREAVGRRELHELVHAERDRVVRRKLRLTGVRALLRRHRGFFANLHLAVRPAARGHLARHRRAGERAERALRVVREVACAVFVDDSEVCVLRHVLSALLHLLLERHALELVEAVRALALRLGENDSSRLADDGHLIHADFDNVNLVGARVHVVKPRLQDLLHYALLARAGERTCRGGLSCLARHDADIADRDVYRAHHLDIVSLRVEAIPARAKHILPHTLRIAVRRKDLAGSELAAVLRGNDTDGTGRNRNRGNDAPVVRDGV